jgi:hypothetical protein
MSFNTVFIAWEAYCKNATPHILHWPIQILSDSLPAIAQFYLYPRNHISAILMGLRQKLPSAHFVSIAAG